MYLRVSHDIIKYTVCWHRINRLVFLVEANYVLCEVLVEYLLIISIRLNFQRVQSVSFNSSIVFEHRVVRGGRFLQEGQYLATLLQLQGVMPFCLMVPSTRMLHATSSVASSVDGKMHVSFVLEMLNRLKCGKLSTLMMKFRTIEHDVKFTSYVQSFPHELFLAKFGVSNYGICKPSSGDNLHYQHIPWSWKDWSF